MAYKRADSLGGVTHRTIEQMRVSLGGLHLRMSEKLTNKRQRCSSGYENARERMAQVMDPQVRLLEQDWGAGLVENGLPGPGLFLTAVDKSCRFANRHPGPLDVDERLILRTAEYESALRLRAHGPQQL